MFVRFVEFGIFSAERCVGPQLKTPSDCLSKTQLRANSKEDVYGATLVQCQNVNGGGPVRSTGKCRYVDISKFQRSALGSPPEALMNDGDNYDDDCSYKIRLFAGTSG